MSDALKKVADAFSKVGSHIAQAPSNEAQAIEEKRKNIEQYKAATSSSSSSPSSSPAQSDSPRDKVGRGPYGSQAGEKRIDTSDMTKPLGSYKHGTDYVPKTGSYILHEGEKVVPKKDNPVANPYALVGAEHKRPKKEIKSITHHMTHDGKIIHTHKHHSSLHPDEQHVSNNMSEMISHLQKHIGAANDGESPSMAGDAAPMTPAPSPNTDADVGGE
jgi:hypothetical protein